jgi:hypothetical protein
MRQGWVYVCGCMRGERGWLVCVCVCVRACVQACADARAGGSVQRRRTCMQVCARTAHGVPRRFTDMSRQAGSRPALGRVRQALHAIRSEHRQEPPSFSATPLAEAYRQGVWVFEEEEEADLGRDVASNFVRSASAHDGTRP